MKKSFLFLALIAFLTIYSCTDDQVSNSLPEQEAIDMSDFFVPTALELQESEGITERTVKGKKNCYSMDVLAKQIADDPNVYKKMYDVEVHTRRFINAKKPSNPGGGGGGGGTTPPPPPPPDNMGVITIPVNVHVIYSKSQENISDAQINSQIAILNQDFRATNSDLNLVPNEFNGRIADTEIQFNLAAVYRHQSSTSSWGTNNSVKSVYPPISPATHLNIWVCNIGGGILGYAQFPGLSPATDGVVISPQYFGNTGYVAAPFNKGRTATHEVGHYLNLRHIWGDGRCRYDDFVTDTPTSDRPNYYCPSYPVFHCKSNDMTMNYMDYVDDACMYMFTQGQKVRLRSIFSSGGARAAMAGN